ncbi:MAG: glycosyltransferase [Thermofilum sp.]|nr:glycosyltransferase [Thermofilum sp.]
MRILHVIPYFPPASAFGGPPRAAYLVARELARRGHEVTVYTTDAKDLRTRIWDGKAPWVEREVDGVRAVYFRNLTMLTVKMFKLFVTPALPARAQKEVKGFDVVHLHEFRTLQNAAAARAARDHGVPYVLQAHGSVPRVGSWKTLKLLYDTVYGYKLLRGASRAIALTKAEARHYKRMGVPEEKIAIVPNGIDLSEYSDLPPKGAFKEKFNVPEDKRIVLYIGRIHWIKGVDILVKAYALLAKQPGFKDTILVIAGPDDGYLGKVKSLVQDLGISDSVLFTGPLYGSDKLSAYVDAEFVVLPSRYETFPYVVLEAYACVKPVIASNVEAMPDIVLHGETGLLFRAGDEKELASALAHLLENPKETEKMGRNARKLAEEKYSMDKIAVELEKVYEEVIH